MMIHTVAPVLSVLTAIQLKPVMLQAKVVAAKQLKKPSPESATNPRA